MASFQDAIVEEAETPPVAAAAPHEDTGKRAETISNHAQQVQLRLERCLRHLGLTPFSSKFIMQFITVRLSLQLKFSRSSDFLMQILDKLVQSGDTRR